MRQWAFAEGEAYGFLLGNGVLQPRGLMTVPTSIHRRQCSAWGTVQKFKTGVNGAFAATPNGGDIFIDLPCLYAPLIALVQCGQ